MSLRAVQAQPLPELRVALVIGNGAYEDGPLLNPANDAREMARALKDLGFEVVEARDATRARMEQALAARDYREFRALVHAMKGSSASIGTDRLTRLCSSLGGLTDAELRLQATALQRTLGAELSTARSQLERHLQERRSSTG